VTAYGSDLEVELQLRTEDLDGQSGHVSNVAYLRLVDEARHRLFGVTPPGGNSYVGGILEVLGTEARYIIGQQSVEYRREVYWRAQTLVVRLWFPRIGTTSCTIAAAVLDGGSEDACVVAEAETVFLRRDDHRPWVIDEKARDVLDRYPGPRPGLRPRPS
jgi:acyl-CoA thioesterase FadM